MNKAGEQLLAVAEWVSYHLGHKAAMILLAAIAILVTLEVVLRYLFHTSTLMADEYAGYFFVGLLYFGSAYVLRAGRSIKIDVLTVRLPRKVQDVLSRFITVLNFPIIVLLSWRGWLLVLDAYQHRMLAATVKATPLYIPMLVVALGLTILALQALAEVVRLVVPERSETKGDEL